MKREAIRTGIAALMACGCAAAWAGSGTVAVTSTNFIASAAHSVVVSFAEHANVTNGLWVAYDEADRGASTNGWANVAFVQTIPPAVDKLEYVLPSGWGETGKKALRFFLSEVPYDVDYTLDSITSTGKNYLVFPDYNLTGASVVEMKCALDSVSGTHPLFCSRKSSSSLQFSAFVVQKNNNPRWRFDYKSTTGGNTTSTGTLMAGSVYSIAASSKGLYVDGSLAQECPASAATFTCGGALAIFAHRNGNAETPSGTSTATLYSFKATNTSKADLNLVPAVKAGVVGVYDTVSGQFFGPSGTGDFTAGTRQESETPIFAASEAVGPIANLDGCVYRTDSELTDVTSRTVGTPGIKDGTGLVTLTGANDFAGQFTVNGGTLAADFGQGLGASDNLKLVSGCFAPLTSPLTAALGTGAGQIDLAGGAVGFSAVSGDVTVNLGGAAADVTIGSVEPAAASPLVLNDARGVHTLTLSNKIVSAGELTIDVQAGRAVIAGGATVAGDLMKTGDGVLAISGSDLTVGDAAESVKIMNGTLALTDGASYHSSTNLFIGRGTTSTSAATLIVSNATLDVGGNIALQAGSGKTDDDVRALIYDGAKITVNSVQISRGELQMYGGTITARDWHGLALGSGFEACRLYGGTLAVRGVRSTEADAAFDWRGGAVRATESRAEDFFMGNLTKIRIGPDGGVFETPAGVNLSIKRGVKKHDADKLDAYSRTTAMTVKAFRKDGAGTLGLAAKNTYLRATEVHEGTLKLWAKDAVPTNGLLRLTGGSFWLNGYDQTVSNFVGTGSVRGTGKTTGGTLTVKGEIWPTGALAVEDAAKLVGKVVFPVNAGGTVDGMLTSTGTLDVAGLDLSIENVGNLPTNPGRIVLVSAETVSGSFKSVSALPNGWRLSVGSRRVSLTNRGLVLLFR